MSVPLHVAYPHDVIWQDATLVTHKITVRASYRLGNVALEAMRDDIEATIAASLGSLVLKILTEHPMAKVSFGD